LGKFVKGVLIGAGTLFVGLGLLGMFLPLLPTTPFLLLAAFCYARSSDRFYRWLMNNRLFGEYIRNYREGRGIAPLHKVIALALLWATIGYAAWFLVEIWWMKALLTAIAVGVTIHLLKVKTLRNQKMTGKENAAALEESGSVME
jgi:uncharacterized membrane protein YbaN (DUF454 family)